MQGPEALVQADGPSDTQPAKGAVVSVGDLERLRQSLIDKLGREGPVDPAAIDVIGARIEYVSGAIRVLQQLASESGEVVKKTRRHKWAIGLVTMILLLTGTVLLLPRPSAIVSIETASSDVDFTLSKEIALFDRIKGLRAVEVEGLSRITEDGKEVASTTDVYGLTLRIEDHSTQQDKPSRICALETRQGEII